MLWSTTSEALKTRVARYGTFIEESSLARFYEAILRASLLIRRKGEWPWKNTTDTLTTTAGVLGPYTPPTNFYRLAQEKKVYQYGYTDSDGLVLAPVRFTDSTRWDLIYRVDQDAFYFRDDPGTGSVTVNFIAEFDATPTEANATAAVTLIPGNLYDIFADFVEADFHMESGDTRQDGLLLMQKADINLSKEWEEYEKGRPKQRQRSPRGMDGYPMDGMGRPMSIRGPGVARYPRNTGRR
jgi:hypothetical protein